MSILFDILFFVYAIFYLPFLFLGGKGHKDFSMRFGVFPESLKAQLNGRKNIWIHAVSVGEILAIEGLVKALKASFPSHSIVVSTVTKTGFALAQKLASGHFTVIYAPLDVSFIVRRFVRAINPAVYI